MTISANAVYEVNVGGSDTNGGGFVTGSSGTDWSQQTSAQYAVTDGVTNGTTTITSATANFGPDVVGNIIYVQGGTGSITAGWYQIVSCTNSTTIVVDRNNGLTTGTGVTLNIGGALASPGIAAAIANVSGNTVFIKYNATPFSVTSTSTNVSGGCLNLTSVAFSGYDTTRTIINTDANRPTIQLNVASAALITGVSNTPSINNVLFDGNSQTSAKLSNGGVQFTHCKFTGFNTATTTGIFVQCEATGNSTAVLTGSCLFCEAYSNTATPYATSSCIVGCLSYGNTGSTTDGFFISSSGAVIVGNTAYGNGRDGFTYSDGSRFNTFANNLSVQNGRFGFNWPVTTNNRTATINNAAYNNTSSDQNNTPTGYNIGYVSLSADPFVNSASNNFAINNTAGGGAALRAAAFPASFPHASTASFEDIGASQHQDTGGGSSFVAQRPTVLTRGTPY